MTGSAEIKQMLGVLTQRLDDMHHDLSTRTSSLGISVDTANNKIDKVASRLDIVAARQISDDFSNDSVGIFETDREGKVIRVNPSFTRMTGLTIEEARGNGWINMIAPQQRHEIETRWQESILRERNFEEDTFLIKNGQRLRARLKIFIMQDGSGKTIGFRCKMSKLN